MSKQEAMEGMRFAMECMELYKNNGERIPNWFIERTIEIWKELDK